MIFFQCPSCRKTMKTADNASGHKVACPLCGQRILVPPRAQATNKTVLGQPVPDPTTAPRVPPAGPEPPPPVLPPGKVLVSCPGCARSILLPPNELSWTIECSRCGMRFVPVPPRPAAPAPQRHSSEEEAGESEDEDDHGSRAGSGFSASRTGSDRGQGFDGLSSSLRYDVRRPHSGLGIASFLIAVLVGGLDVILSLVIAVNIAKSAPPRPERGAPPAAVANALVGGMSLYCLNCMSVPVCLVGVGLGIVGLVAHRDCNHVFTWIGLLANAVVILGVVALYVLGAMVSH